VVVRAPATSGTGENTGFLVLTSGGTSRRVPYAFLVERPALAHLRAVALKQLQQGTTAVGPNRVSSYCCPSAPFGPPPSYTGPAMNEDGSEHLYSYELRQPAINFGVSVILESSGALVDPFVLGSKDENDVQGYSGTPVDVNPLTFDFGIDVGAAGVQFTRVQRFFVAVDSRTDPFTNRPAEGRYVLRGWVDDVFPPTVRMVTTRVSAGRPLLVGQAFDLGSGVDPLSLVLNYSGVLLAASQYDPVTGLILFGLPTQAPALKRGTTDATVFASDFQEAKNINPVGGSLLPNSTFLRTRLKVVAGPAVTWLEPDTRGCVSRAQSLLVAGSSTARVRKVVFRDGGRTFATVRKGRGVYAAAWHAGSRGRHVITVTLVDARGRSATTSRRVDVCK
jgi:hypothetical protein